jgi:hypothetical protein
MKHSRAAGVIYIVIEEPNNTIIYKIRNICHHPNWFIRVDLVYFLYSCCCFAMISLLRMRAGWRLWRVIWFIAWLFWWQFVSFLAWVMQTLYHSGVTIMSASNIPFVDLLMFPFDVLGGCAARIHATSFTSSSWYVGLLSSRRFGGGQCRCCGMPSCPSALGL